MTTKKKRVLLITLLSLIAVFVIGGTLAYFTDTDSRQNVITLGKVSGTLTETGEDSREDESIGKDYDNIKPGQTLAKDPKVTLNSDSEDAYARIKITYTDLTDAQITELENLLTLNAGWQKAADGYFYYNQIMTADDETTIFDEVMIPSTWGNEMAEKTFRMNVVAELIQADNFTPTVDASGYITSWGDVTIEANEG